MTKIEKYDRQIIVCACFSCLTLLIISLWGIFGSANQQSTQRFFGIAALICWSVVMWSAVKAVKILIEPILEVVENREVVLDFIVYHEEKE